MTDSQLLSNGYEALHEAHTLAAVAFREIHDAQEMGAPVRGAEHARQFRAIRDKCGLATCAFLELEQRAKGVPPARAE